MKRHCYERNIIEIKNEYSTFLTNILIPILYEGIQSVYNHSEETKKKIKDTNIDDTKINSMNKHKIFKMYLQNIEKMNNVELEKEIERIKISSKCNDWFDDLVKAVIKSNIVLLTYNVSEKTCKLIDNKFHEKTDISLFLHKCYIECAKIFYNNPEIIEICCSKLNSEIKTKSKKRAREYIKISINEAINRMLPMKQILDEYLSNDYINDDNEYICPNTFNRMKEMFNDEEKYSEKSGNNDDHIDNIKIKENDGNKMSGKTRIKDSKDYVNLANAKIGDIVTEKYFFENFQKTKTQIDNDEDDNLNKINDNLIKLKENCLNINSD